MKLNQKDKKEIATTINKILKEYVICLDKDVINPKIISTEIVVAPEWIVNRVLETLKERKR